MSRDIYAMGPKRRGIIYCSPWCGANCTWVAHQKAHRDAEELCKRLGPDFVPRVWENMGWHYCVRTRDGRLKIHVDHYGGERYTAFLSYDDSPGGQWVEHGKTPEAVVRAIRRCATRNLGQAIAMLESIP